MSMAQPGRSRIHQHCSVRSTQTRPPGNPAGAGDGVVLYNQLRVAYQRLHALVQGLIQQMPVKGTVMVPFVQLSKFATHEQ